MLIKRFTSAVKQQYYRTTQRAGSASLRINTAYLINNYMARPVRLDVEYFPHPVTHGKKMFYLEDKYQNDGYACWFKLLEQLGKADRHYIDIADELSWLYLASYCKVDEQRLRLIIDDLIRLDEFDKELYQYGILYNEKFVLSVQDAYRKRTNFIPNRHNIIKFLCDSKRIKTEVYSKSYPVIAAETLVSAPETIKNAPEMPQREREIEREREIKDINVVDIEKGIQKPSPPSKLFSSMLELKTVLLQSEHQGWRDLVCITRQLPEDQFGVWINEFYNHCVASGKNHLAEQEFKSHFMNWLKFQEITKQPASNEPRRETMTERVARMKAEAKSKGN
jgi:hypothetical protein